MSKPLKIPFSKLSERARKENISLEVIFKSKIPSFRSFDISKDVDLIEEILRIYGYTNIEPQKPILPLNTEIKKPFEEKIRYLLTDRGFNEVITFPWIEENLRKVFGIPSYWEIINPLNTDQRHMRTSLIPSLVKVAKFNQNNFNRNLAIFELGKIYLENGETPTLGLLAVGEFRKYPGKVEEWNFLTFKGIIEAIFQRLGIEKFSLLVKEIPYMHPYLSAEIRIDETPIGYFGKLHPSIAEKLELKSVPFVGELNIETIKRYSQKPQYKPFSKFPPSRRDFAFVVEEKVGVTRKLLEIAQDIFGDLLEDIFIFDIYRGEKIGKGKVSIAVRVVLRHPEKSLSDEEVNAIADKFIAEMAKEGFVLRA